MVNPRPRIPGLAKLSQERSPTIATEPEQTPHADSWDDGAADGDYPDGAVLAEIEAAAREFIAGAAKIVLERFGGPLEIEYKNKARTDPVTEADKAVEAYLVEAVGQRFPTHAVLGEEGHDPEGEFEFEWIVDPIDGTINFINRLPFFAVSIGVLHRRRPVVGALHFPLSGQTLHARRGGGAFQDGTPIHVHPATEPSGRVTAGMPPGYIFQFKTGRAGRGKLGEPRSLGSIAYEIGLVANGGFGWAIFRGPKIWDMAGGIPIVTEAGGVALYYTGAEKGWQPLERFEVPPSKDPAKPKRLRDWNAPMIVGAAPIAGVLAPQIAPRRMPVALVRARQTYRGWRRWLPKKRKEDPATQETAPETVTPPPTTPIIEG